MVITYLQSQGAEPTMIRSILAGISLLATYSQVKDALLKTKHFQDNLLTQFIASSCSGFLTSVVCVPADIAKTRIQNMNHIEAKRYKNTLVITCFIHYNSYAVIV